MTLGKLLLLSNKYCPKNFLFVRNVGALPAKSADVSGGEAWFYEH